MRAFAAFHSGNPRYRLVLAGMKGFGAASVEKQIAQSKAESFIEVTGWIPRERLLDLYRRARAFVYPSTFEGFGMPVIEALAAAIPLACSDIEPLRGLASSDAVLFNPDSDESMAVALEDLLHAAPRPNDRVRSFTWQRTAELTLRVLKG